MRRLALAAAGGAALLALAGCDKSPVSDKAFGDRVRAYLLEHPEVIQEAVQKLQAKQDEADRVQAEADMAKARARLPANRQAMEHDARDFVANPTGRLTLTQFYDYRCPHCVRVAPKVVAFIAANPDVRVVFKEMPIFGPASEYAAQVALAVKASGGDYVGYYTAVMEGGPAAQERLPEIAQANGAKPELLRSAQQTGEAHRHLTDTQALFTRIGLGGTPAFIIGDSIIPGEDMDAVNAAVVKARAATPLASAPAR